MILEVKDIHFSYREEKPVFQGVNLEVKKGEIVSIVGSSGTGKSTLLKCFAGLLDVSSGEIFIEGEKLNGPSKTLIAGHPEIAIVNQLFELDVYFTVQENITNQLHHLASKVRQEFVNELLDVFELTHLAAKKSKDISGGEQQRLSMACALAKEPRLLLLDEPFVHLDVHLSKKIGNYIKKLAEIREMGVILVTHDGIESLSWSHRIIFMNKGKFRRIYTPEKAYHSPETLYEGSFFGELNSVAIEGKEFLFRPTQYSFQPTEEQKNLVEVNWEYSLFKGMYYANYFSGKKGEEIVLYAPEELKLIDKFYV